MFFYLCKLLFSGFHQVTSNLVDAQNNSKYRDWAPLTIDCREEKEIEKLSNLEYVCLYSWLTYLRNAQ